MDPLEPRISGRELPEDIARAREQDAEKHAATAIALQPKVEAHLATYSMALDVLDDFQQRLADDLDLDLVGDTRPAAVWLMAGRCLQLSRAMLALLSLGFTAPAVILARSLHEADRLLDAFADSKEDELLEMWLADHGTDWVRPKATREARERNETWLEDKMSEAGAPPFKHTEGLSFTLYDHLSRAAHNRRSWVEDEVDADLRLMARGPHPNPIRRASTLEVMGHVIEEAIQSVGDALTRFYGPEFFRDEVQPLIQSLRAVREAQQLT